LPSYRIKTQRDYLCRCQNWEGAGRKLRAVSPPGPSLEPRLVSPDLHQSLLQQSQVTSWLLVSLIHGVKVGTVMQPWCYSISAIHDGGRLDIYLFQH